MKTINCSDSTWKILTKDKYALECKTLEELILRYRNIVTKMQNEKVTKRTDEAKNLNSLPTGNNQELPEHEESFL